MTVDDQAKMPFLAHLAELRGCLARAGIGIFVCSLVSFAWASELFAFLTSPLRAYFVDADLIGTGPAEAFLVKLKAALVAGLIVSSPYSFFELWRFVAPGLYQNERKIALPFVFASTVCFLTGISFCFYVLFPFAFQFFEGEFVSIGIKPQIRIGEYLTFVVKLLLVFGLVFELPILSFFLARLRLLHHRWLLKNGRFAVIAIFVIAAILTPPDVITQVLLALPLLVLYGICIGIAYVVNPESRKTPAKPPTVEPPAGTVPKR
ncbi:MAG: twin-arginine translocase subunit TatC [Bdellovibrionales bacterium]|nr:twin-arginine translocase subunit TatC [Bdellovibrionales bacterium]